MKQRYLLLAMIILVFLLFSTTCLSVLAVTPNLELTPSTQSVTVGSQANINVVVEDVTDLRGANIVLNFDASQLQYVSSDDGGFILTATLFDSTSSGSVTLDIVGIGTSAYASGTGTIMTVVFNRIASGNTNITFGTTELRDKDNIDITHTTGNGCSIIYCLGDFGGPNGYPDNKVDFEDLMIFAIAYGSCEGDANWNPICDIASSGGSLAPDGCIDFEDLMIFALHYGDDCGSCTLPPAPTLSDPGGTLSSPATYTVDWSSVSGAAYVLQEATSSDFSSGLQEYTPTGTSRSFSHTVSTDTTYYYRVAATDDCGQSGWSNVENIKIEGGSHEGTKWTIMVYIDGDNTLDDCAWDDLSELESVSSTDEIKIITQLDAYYSCSGTFRYYITGSAPGVSYPLYPDDIVQTLPEQNMADPATLTSFVNWAAANYPAEKYLLVLWNHGGGWRENNIPIKGIIVDDTSGDFMTMAELVQGLNGINEGIDIIGFDACLMQMAEVAYEIYGITNAPDYMVGSQASEWGDGWPYDDILVHLLANPGMTDTVLCETIVNDFINYCGTVGTLSALDFSAGTYDTYTALNSFAAALMASSYQNEITTARSSAQSYSYSSGYRCKDIYDFAERIKSSVPDCQSEAQAVMNQVNDLVLFEAHTGSAVASSHGLSIYLPDNASEYDDDYNDLQFAVDTQWDEFLQGEQNGQDKVTDVSAIAITSTLPDMSKLKEKINQLKSEENVSSCYMINKLKPLKKGIVEKLIEVEWHSYPEATGYRIYKSINGAGYSLIKDWQAPPGYDWYALWDYDVVEGNTYSYYVIAYGSFGETSPSQEALIDTWLPSCSLINPSNGSVITDPIPAFNWNPAGVSSFPYGSIYSGESDLWVYDENVSSTSWWTLFNNLTTSSATYNQDGQATPLIDGHTYEWNSWAYGYDGDGNLIAMSWSEDWGFHYGSCTLSPAPTLSDPGSTLTSPATYTVSWSSVSGAAYVLQEATSSDFSSGLQEYTPTGTSRSFSHTVSSDTTYYYRVAAVDDCGQSGWSNVENIKIEVAPSGGAKWTIMVYMDGDNDLELCYWYNLYMMESVGSTEEVNIVVQMDLYDDCTGTFRYYVTGVEEGSEYPLYPDDIVQTLPEQDMTDPAVLTDFINWAGDNYPADHYMLFLVDHGGGWREEDGFFKGIFTDITSGPQMMQIPELAQSLDNANIVIDILDFDACLMQMIEVAWEIGKGMSFPPNYLIASEAIGWTPVLPYDDFLAQLIGNPDIEQSVICETIVNGYINNLSTYSGNSGTMSALHFNNEFLNNGLDIMNNFANALINSMYQNEISNARLTTQNYAYNLGYRCKDLFGFAERIKNNVSDCQTEAQAIMDLITNIIIAEGHYGSDMENSHGLSIYIPDNASEYDNNYDSLQFTTDTQWDEFLQ
jgi:hypothetical protein